MDMEIKYEEYENVMVKTFCRNLKEIKNEGDDWSNSYVFMDELDVSGLPTDDDLKPKDLIEIQAKSVWVVIRQTQSEDIGTVIEKRM